MTGKKRRGRIGRPPTVPLDEKEFSGIFTFRIGSTLHEALARLAARESRSLNGQVIHLLREGCERNGMKVEDPK